MTLRSRLLAGGFVGLVWLVAWTGAVPAAGQAAPAVGEDVTALTDEFQRILRDYVTLEPPPPGALAEYHRWRDRIEAPLNELVRRLEDLALRSGDPPDVLLVLALVHAKRADVYLSRRRETDAEYLAKVAAYTPEAVRRDHPSLVAERARLAALVAQEYDRIEQRLEASLRRAEQVRDRPNVALVRGVILAQSAIVRDAAVDAAEAAGTRFEFDPVAGRKLLDDAKQLLDAYLAVTPRDQKGIEYIRGRFYLGVIEYRRSLMIREPEKEFRTELDPSRADAFAAARSIFEELSDPDYVYRVIRPFEDPERLAASEAGQAFLASGFSQQSGYDERGVSNYYAATAHLYLALATVIDPAYAHDRDELMATAYRLLDRALELDRQPPAEGQPAISLTLETVPLSVARVRGELEAFAAVPERRPLNDLGISFGVGALYDTNVTLLGRDTAPPRHQGRKRDFRTYAQLRMDYVADLDAFDPGNDFLRRWQVFFQGRVSSTWNARIHDFNEQFYGGSVNLRYELLGPQSGIPNLDGMYAHVRYDYDQIMLGNNGFLSLNRLRPMLQIVLFDSVVDTTLFFSYERRNYLEKLFDRRFNRDGDYISGGLDVHLDLGKWVDGEKLWKDNVWGPYAPREDDPDYRRPLRFSTGIEFTSNSTAGDEFDYSSAILSAGMGVPLPWGVDFVVGAIWEWQDYWQPSLIDRNRRTREAFIQEYSFRAERKFFLTRDYSADFQHTRPLALQRLAMTLYGDVRFTIDDSNIRDRFGQSIFEYNRVQYGAGVRFDLN